MLKLINVGKVYATRRKRNIYGLKDVNLNFPNKGLCLILGKSGGGKTTLLNILGGLDVKFEGEYVFMDKKLESKDFSEFRQNYVSFVFQDFNLIDDYNVAENVALGGRLSHSGGEEVSSLLKKVGLEGYEKRLPQELSGGQQQRVAIARALLKDSKLLLADEPTGNLDNENSQEIYKLLKEISKDKLVIVVSHDEELASQYADYIVRLNRGKVVESSLECGEETGEYTVGQNRILSNKEALKMATREFTRNKPKSIATIILMAICFCVLSFTVIVVPLFKLSDVHYRLIKDKQYEYFNLTDVKYDEYNSFISAGYEVVVGNQYSINLSGREEAERIGFKFVSDEVLPLDENSYYISDYKLRELATPDMMGKVHNWAIIDGAERRFSVDEILTLVGQQIRSIGYNKVCAGIYHYEQPYFMNEFEAYGNAFYNEEIYSSISRYCYGNEDRSITVVCSGKANDINGVNVNRPINSLSGTYLLTNDGIQQIDYNNKLELLLDENEIALGLDVFNGAFQAQYNIDDLVMVESSENSYEQPVVNVKRIPSEIGKSISLQLSDGKTVDDLIVRGIVFNTSGYASNNLDKEIVISHVNKSDKELLLMYTSCFPVWIKTSTVKNLQGLLATHNSYRRCDIYTPLSSYEHELSDSFQTVQIVSLAVCLALIIATIIMTNLLISGQITDQKRKIGIFKALGAKNRDIWKIYLFEILLIAAAMIVLTILATLLVTTIFNNEFVKAVDSALPNELPRITLLYPELTIVYYQWVNIPITIAAVFTLLFIGVVSPLRKINKLNVIEAIKDTNIK